MRESKKQDKSRKNVIRKKIKEIFPNRKCYTLVRPVENEKELRNVQLLKYEKLRENFRRQMEELIEQTSLGLESKRFKNKKMSGKIFAEYVRIITNAINSGKIPKLVSMWDRLIESKVQLVLQKYTEQIKVQTKEIRLEELGESELDATLDKIKDRMIFEVLSEDLEQDRQQDVIKKIGKIFQSKAKELKQKFLSQREKQIAEIQKAFSAEVQELLNSKREKQAFLLNELFEDKIGQILKEKSLYAEKNSIVQIQRLLSGALDQLNQQHKQRCQQLEIDLSKIQGKYDAAKNLLENQKKIMDDVLEETKQANKSNIESYQFQMQQMKENYEAKLTEESFRKEKEKVQ